MTKKCPKCGFENKDEADFCANCGKPLKWSARLTGRARKTDAGKAVVKTGEKLATYGIWGTIIIFIIKFAIFGGILFLLLSLMKDSLLTTVGEIAPGGLKALIISTDLIVPVIALGLGLGFALMHGFKIQIFCIVVLVVIIIALPYISKAVTTVSESAPLNILGGQSSTLGSSTQATKTGKYAVVDLKFGEEITGYMVSSMIKSLKGRIVTIAPYSFQLTAENANENGAIKNFKFEGASIIGGIDEAIIGPMNSYGGVCQSAPCDIQPNDKIVLNVRRDDCSYYPLQQYESDLRTTSLYVTVSYDYSGEGTNKFFILQSQDYLKDVEESVQSSSDPIQTSSAGPVDITVYFVPGYYAPLTYQSSSVNLPAEVSVYVKLSKSGTNIAKIKSITITHLDSDGSVHPGGNSITDANGNIRYEDACTTPWGTKYDLVSIDSHTERIDFSDWSDGFPLIKEQTHYCDYTFDAQASPYKSVPFLIDVNYTYEQTAEQSVEVTDASKLGVSISCPTTTTTTTTTSTTSTTTTTLPTYCCFLAPSYYCMTQSDCTTISGVGGATACTTDADCQI